MAPDDITPEADETGENLDGTYEYVDEIVEYKDTRWLRTLLVVILIILLLLLAGLGYLLVTTPRTSGSGGAATDKMVWVRSIYGWGPRPDQQFLAPISVATAPDGTIWANSNNSLAVAFNANGSFDRLLLSNPASNTANSATGTPGSHAGAPSLGAKSSAKSVQTVAGLDVDSKNNLYIVDDSAGNLLKFTPEGRLVSGWSIPNIARASANDSRVAVLGRDKVGVLEQSTGNPVFAFGTRGQGTNQFDLPAGVHIDSQGFVYVADTQNQRVRKYTPSGRLMWDAGTLPDRTTFQQHVELPKGIFQLPTGVTTDAYGRVIVIDAFNYNITVLNGANGKKIASYGEYGQADGQFDNPTGITYDAKRDYFVVADTGNNRLQVVRIPGSAPIAPTSVITRAFENPAWVLCIPPIVLLLAALVASVLRRRRKKDAEAAADTADTAA
jgi:DNA-binding beta-propeller fold protein YncE